MIVQLNSLCVVVHSLVVTSAHRWGQVALAFKVCLYTENVSCCLCCFVSKRLCVFLRGYMTTTIVRNSTWLSCLVSS